MENIENEARLVQAQKHQDDTSALLETIIVQNERNKPQPELEVMIEQNDKTKKAIEESGDKVSDAIKDLKPAMDAAGFIANFMSAIKGDKGDTPIKGKDYFTKEEVKEFKDEVTPVKGKDYFTDKEVSEFKDDVESRIKTPKDGYTPVKGKDYFTSSELEEIINSCVSKIPTPKDGLDGEDAIIDYDKIVKEVVSKIPRIKKETSKTTSQIIEELKGNLSINDLKDLPLSFRTSARDYSFIELTDTPKSYKGKSGKFIKVNSTEDGLEYGEGGGLSKVTTDSTLTGDGTPESPLHAVGDGIGDMLKATYDPANGAKQVAFNDSVVHNTGNENIAGDKTFTGEVYITDSDGSIAVRENLIHTVSTGVHDGCNLTRPNSTQFTISSGTIERVDATVVPGTYAEYTFAGGTYTNTFLTSPFTYVLIGIDGTVYQQDTEPSMATFTDKAYVSVIANSGGVQIASSSRAYSVSVIGNQVQEYLRIVGALNVKGSLQASANGANTSINTTAGSIWRIGANYDTDRTKPNTSNITAKTPLSFVQYYVDGSGVLVPGSLVTTMNTSQYNNAGTLATLATNKWCNHRLYMSPNGFGLMLTGSVIYNSLALAIAGRANEKWNVPGLISDQAPVAWVTVKGQTTDLSITTDNDILSVASFSGGSGGGATGGGDMLASTYDPTGKATDAFSMDNMTQGSTNKFISSAQLTVLGNTSGTNTGDNATNTTSNSYADAKVVDAINDGVTTTAPSQNAVFDALALKAPLASPAFTGTPSLPSGATGVTQSANDNSTKFATTAYVDANNTRNNAITATANAATANIAYRVNTITNNSAATLTITIPTSGAVDGQLVMIRVLDFSAVAQTLTFVNTENGEATVPATSNGSTTLPRAVGLQFNSRTTKWRCIAA